MDLTKVPPSIAWWKLIVGRQNLARNFLTTLDNTVAATPHFFFSGYSHIGMRPPTK